MVLQKEDEKPAAQRSVAPPHRPLLRYYAAPDERFGFVRDLFNRTAGSYDGINGVLSFGSGAWYRRRSLLRAGLKPGARMLDVAVGTGLVAREAVRLLGRADDVIGLDVSEGMLGVARSSLRMPFVQARAEALPLRDAGLDFISMGYALRHVSDLLLVFGEFRRVLRPGGRLLLLEMGRPEGGLGYTVAKAYLGGIVPALSRFAGAESRTLMRYYWDTIDACVPAADILRHLREVGFAEVGCETELGIFRAYTARRAAD
ncbi:MAG TPA: class I SAM-dependent methyltransferase [Falsiroseomonas sp.]|nr:class I SAM-dependent methyltransferase [Falsiroseomonas sp.]